MTCPTCYGIGKIVDPRVAPLIVSNLLTGGEKSDEIDALRKQSGKTGMYWMVDTCPVCKGTGEVT